MKFGMIFANAGPAAQPDHAAALGQIAEEAGLESLWTVEHAVVPAGYESQYPYSRDGRMPGGEDTPIPDPVVWLAFVAAHTTRITLGTGILILPQRNPVVLAKEAATLDVLCGGRLILGVGVGWLREEFDALGVPFEERGARTDEGIQALRALWTQQEPTFEGRFSSFSRAKSFPKPVRPGGVPIAVGGHSEAAARRAGRLGDGFFPAGRDPEKVPGLIKVMRAAAEEAGRDPDAIEITTSMAGSTDIDAIRRLEDLGVSRIVVPPLGFDVETLRTQVARFADEVIAKAGG
ncbi:MAG TPA: LLM class F420-dependent oxidoreductase [Acidimicrobiales bacterium]|nr:LLM class F420-dependent oxidoreductase [Acidimicrobiales bacterium]